MHTIKPFFLCCALLFSTFFVSAFSQEPNQAMQGMDKKFFIENKGQWPKEVLFLCRMGGLDAWITKTGINYTFYKIEKQSSNKTNDFPRGKFDYDEFENATLLGHRVIMDFEGCNANPLPEGKQKQEGYYNYLIGNDPSKHASYVGLYREAIVRDVYNGIDMRYYYDKGSLRYDFIVAPGADPSQIVFNLRGQYSEYLKANNLCFTTRFGEVAVSDLYTYQENNTIPSHFIHNRNTWQVALGEYDHTKPLVIDPLVYSTYLGGASNDIGHAITLDNNNNALLVGDTHSADYDITPGAFQTIFGGFVDIFVTKLNPNGTGLVFSTLIGGNNADQGFAITLDSFGIYITGTSGSNNYYTSPGAFQSIGFEDVVVTKLNATGSSIIYSTAIGGNAFDAAHAIAVDSSGNAFITGRTVSTDFDVTPNAFQTVPGAGLFLNDVFVTKLNSTGTGLVYSTYLGGVDEDWAWSIALDDTGNAYVVGYTESTNYDITAGAFQTILSGIGDAFITKLNSTGTNLIYSTFLGGGSHDEGYGIALDDNNNAYMTGITGSTDYDVTAGAFQTILNGPSDVFITKLNSTGTNLIYSTFLGGGSWEKSISIALDANNNAYVVGHTESIDYDITAGSYQATLGGSTDVFVTKLNSTGNGLLYSTFIGGNTFDWGNGIVLDVNDNAYVTGSTWSTDYDVTPGAYQTIGVGEESFVTKMNLSATVNISDFESIENSFSVYPNPANSTIHVKCSHPIQSITVEDMVGRILKSTKELGTQKDASISVHDLSIGMYLIRVNGQYSSKWIKE